MRRKIFVLITVITLLVAMASTALATDDTFPYLGWSQFRVLKDGKAGHDVRGLQQHLLMCGYNPGTVDGSFGPNTTAAVKRYQSAKGLGADGIVGAQTWTSLRNHLAEFCPNYNEVSYVPWTLVGVWSNQNYDQDRFLHRSDGSWWVNYSNDYTYYGGSPVQMWAP
jgi:peptidoglycan hydrolase-like protein with peptidoglycan-binding domain